MRSALLQTSCIIKHAFSKVLSLVLTASKQNRPRGEMKEDTSCLVCLVAKKVKTNSREYSPRSAALRKCNNWDSHGWRCRQAACVSPLEYSFWPLAERNCWESGNHSYKESLPVTSSWVAQITEAEPYTKSQGNKVRQKSKSGIMYLGGGWGLHGRRVFTCMWPNLGYKKWPLCFWRCLSTKRKKGVFTYHPEQRFSRWNHRCLTQRT